MAYRLALLMASLFFSGGTLSLLAPALPTLRMEFGLSYTAIGALAAAWNLARVSASLVFGLNPRRMAGAGPILFAGVCFVGGALLGAGASSYPMLLVAVGLMGLASSVFNTLMLYGMSLLAPPEKRATIMGYYQATWNLSGAVYPVLGGLAAYLIGWRWNFAVMLAGGAAATALGWLAWGRYAPPTPTTRDQPAAADDSARSRASLWVPLIAVYCVVGLWFLNRTGFRMTLLPLYAEQALSLNEAQIGLGLGLINVVGTMIVIPGAMLADRVGLVAVLLPGLAVMSLGMVSFLLVGDYPAFLAASAFAGAADVYGGTQVALLLSLSPTSLRARVVSIYRVVSDASGAAFPLLVGALLDTIGAIGSIWSLAATPVLLGVVVWAAIRGRPVKVGG